VRIAYIDAGEVEYSATEAKIEVDSLIAALQRVKAQGATHVVGLSGNYRGPQYVNLSEPYLDD